MARKRSSMAPRIRTMLSQGKKTEAIARKIGCRVQYVREVRSNEKRKQSLTAMVKKASGRKAA